MGMQNVQKLENRIFEAMRLQCFTPTLRECALIRKLVLLACRVYPWLFYVIFPA